MLQSTFNALKSNARTAFIPFIMAGDPDAETTLSLMHQLVDSGGDIIKLGMPFSDPMADGPVIEAAGHRALKAGMTLQKLLALVKAFRQSNQRTPIVLMGYCNPLYAMGWETFAQHAAEAQINGLILVDLPTEEEDEVLPHLKQAQIDLIQLIAPTTESARQSRILRTASGFIYYVAVAGITGDQSADSSVIAIALAALREKTDLPIAVGFGIKTPQDAAAMATLADGVVVGSALVRCLHEKGSNATATLAKALAESCHA